MNITTKAGGESLQPVILQIQQMATILGSAGININGMQVGSTPKSDTNIMAIAVGDDIPNDIMLQLRGVEGIIDVKLINCEG